MSFAIASRYARALADIVRRTGDYAPALAELEDFRAVWRESAELREVFENPVIPLADKRRILDAILARLGTSRTMSNFLRVLLAHFRMGMLEEVARAYRQISNQRMGVVEVKISSAQALTEAEQSALAGRFSQLTGKKAEIAFQQDTELLGGILAQVGSVVYDGSIKGYLERLGASLTAA